ncbi:cyclic lactone autoinducer peptide [Paenibacillus donghaensis]|uniref:Cyclic lactone autoinducer peptide n=1 Tax=Paenibacillus donghaensis TaxID=414771 RepID=A0A2Z2KQ63_9BACL|nr:cyclic lactone autoinducer peptide [Paenibacillus donghaensis]ASA20978.1 hypothetical protein B9T62_09375 [Paenibacillus donghaensis]
MLNLVKKVNRSAAFGAASFLSVIALGIVNTASIVFIYSGETPEELLK